MGNILCRDKTPRRVYVKGPAAAAADYNPHLFQADSLVNGTKKESNIFYSTPNLNDSDMKSTISLDARIFDSGNFKRPPVAPPRRRKGTLKKGSTLPATFSSDSVCNGGFKDVFGNASISSANNNNFDDIDYIDKEENSLQERATSTPEKKLRVGNRKSDKILGESLSDRLSDEPISPISKNAADDESIDPKLQTDKKLSFFLMNMLDDIRDVADAEHYKGQKPVEEPIIVPKKRVTKHICDDDDHMHSYMHKHESDHSSSSNGSVAPPKPDRDFSKFKAAENENVIEIQTISADITPIDAQTKVVVKRGISRENLPSPPATPQRRSGVTSLPSTPTITIESIETIELTNASAGETAASAAHTEKREQQTESEMTEMVDEMIKKAYGMSAGFHPEDHPHTVTDETVTPTSKLAVRKISTPRKVSTASSPDLDIQSVKSVELALPTTSPFKKKSFCEDPAKLEELLEESHRKFYDIDQAARVPKSPVPENKHDKAPVAVGTSINDMIDEIYSRNSEIMQEFQSFLEQSLEKEPVINVEEEKKFVESKKTLGDDEVEPYPPKDNEDGLDDCSYSDSFESSDAEPEVLTMPTNEITNNSHLKRRESIEDVDNWFSHHVEMEETESDILNSARNDPPRPSSGYDTQKIFPFGPTIMGRRDSHSDEFFSEHPILLHMKPNIDTVPETEKDGNGAAMEDAELKESRESSVSRDSNKSKSPDHSTLLKYFDNGSISNEAKDNSKKE